MNSRLMKYALSSAAKKNGIEGIPMRLLYSNILGLLKQYFLTLLKSWIVVLLYKIYLNREVWFICFRQIF